MIRSATLLFLLALVSCEEEPLPATETVATASVTAFRIVPNPIAAQTELRYSLVGEGRVRLLITDASGRTTLDQDEGTRSTGDHVYRWDTTALPPGTYYCALYLNDERLVEKAVKSGSP